MVIVPNSKVKLIKNPLKLDSNNEMMFSNATAQYNYFTSLPKLEFNNLTYIRKDDVLRIPTDETGVGVTYEKLLQYNFCMYQNTSFGNKWFYAFIDEVKWINPSLTEVHLITAYYQTWQFDLVLEDSFIEREHVNDDTTGLHTIPEGLETGPYVCNAYDDVTQLYTNLKIVMGSTAAPSGEGNFIGGVYNGIYSGVKYYTYSDSDTTLVIKSLADAGKADALSSLFLAPEFIVPTSGGGPVTETASPIYITKSINKQTTLDSYSPHNNKLKSSPYCYLLVTNGNGGSVTYNQELFTTAACGFTIMGSLTPGCSIRIIPNYYKNAFNAMGNFFDEGLNLGKYPQLNWATDMYTNWLTQTAINTITDTAGGTLMGALTGGSAGALIGGASTALQGITNAIGQSFIADRIPPQTRGNTNCGDVVTGSHHNTFHFYSMSIKSEYAKVIDNYFDMFGYKVNRVGTPHLHARTYYDYIKTIEANIEGNIPEHDLVEIRKMFNNGIRFWHSTSNYLDFSVNNTIIS